MAEWVFLSPKKGISFDRALVRYGVCLCRKGFSFCYGNHLTTSNTNFAFGHVLIEAHRSEWLAPLVYPFHRRHSFSWSPVRYLGMRNVLVDQRAKNEKIHDDLMWRCQVVRGSSENFIQTIANGIIVQLLKKSYLDMIEDGLCYSIHYLFRNIQIHKRFNTSQIKQSISDFCSSRPS